MSVRFNWDIFGIPEPYLANALAFNAQVALFDQLEAIDTFESPCVKRLVDIFRSEHFFVSFKFAKIGRAESHHDIILYELK